VADAVVVVPLEGHPLAGARLVETCAACPTQYDVHLPDGRTLYFRYRFARWQLHLDGPSGPSVQGEGPGEGLDGWLSAGEVLDLLERAVPLLLARLSP
jgi:hypothetical protein